MTKLKKIKIFSTINSFSCYDLSHVVTQSIVFTYLIILSDNVV